MFEEFSQRIRDAIAIGLIIALLSVVAIHTALVFGLMGIG